MAASSWYGKETVPFTVGMTWFYAGGWGRDRMKSSHGFTSFLVPSLLVTTKFLSSNDVVSDLMTKGKKKSWVVFPLNLGAERSIFIVPTLVSGKQ